MFSNPFLTGAVERANHHAKQVLNVLPVALGNLQLIGAKVKTHRTNIVWFEVNGKDYVIAYNHNQKMMDIRNKNQQGQSIFMFDDNTPLKNINNVFLTL